MKVAYHKPLVNKSIYKILTDSVNSGWLTTGPKVKEFESKLSEYLHAQNVIAVNSCTAALHLILAALDLPKGSRYIAPTYTFVATVEVGEYLGLTPVLIDSLADSFNLNLDHVEQVLKDDLDHSIRAIVPVHFAGQALDMKRLYSIAEKYDIYVIEDCAHATETISNCGKVGNTKYAAAFSFYANKNITTGGEGGAVATNDSDLATKIRKLSLHGMSRDGWNRFKTGGAWAYDVSELGYKYNMTDISASFGLDQLSQIENWHDRRIKIANMYIKTMSQISGIECPSHQSGPLHAWHLFIIKTIPEMWKINRDQIINHINENGIGTSVHYIPVHMHSYYVKKYGYNSQDFPIAQYLSERVISLPIFPGMTNKEVEYVISTISSIWETHRK